MNLLLTRREEREFVFLMLFESDFNNYSFNEILENKNEAVDENFLTTKFIKEIFFGVKENQSIIDDLISKHSLKWNMDRISKVSVALLRIAIYEILFRSDIPLNVSINEAVELAKKYGVESESAFINGILASICKETENSMKNE